MLAPAFHTHQYEVPIVKTVAAQQKGLDELYEKIKEHQQRVLTNSKRLWLLAERAWHLIQQKRMKDLTKADLAVKIKTAYQQKDFNLYQFVKDY
jgi:LAO/AO transport system kinase